MQAVDVVYKKSLEVYGHLDWELATYLSYGLLKSFSSICHAHAEHTLKGKLLTMMLQS